MSLLSGWKLVAAGLCCWAINGGAIAQQIDLTALQAQADAAIAQAQQELRDTDAVVRFTRDSPTDSWSLTITGSVAGTPVDFTGTVASIEVQNGVPMLIVTPPTPTFTATADLCTPMLRAGAAALLNASPFLTELFFDISAPLEESADPDRFDGVDLDTLPLFTVTTTIRKSPLPTIKDWVNGDPLTPAESYLSLATDFGLTKEAVQDLIAYRLDADQTVEAFRAGAVKLLSELGVSETSASGVFDLRRSLGKTPEYFQQALNLLVGANEPVEGIIGGGLNYNDPDGVFARIQDPGDIEIELSGEAEIEVSVPPFIKVKVKVGVKVKGTVGQLAELQEAVDSALSSATDKARTLAKEQLETLRDTIQQLVDMFMQYIDSLQMPAWLKWILR